jgi:hypothetical protein
MTAYLKVAKGSFSTGAVSLMINTSASPTEREIEGKVILKLAYPSFVKGVWIKLVGINSIVSDKFGCLSHDLFAGDEEHHIDGLHQVFIGFGEGDFSNGTFLELAPGRHIWPFHFKLPYYAPASYYDGKIHISYKLIVTLDSPSVQALNGKMNLQYEWVIFNYSNFSHLRIKDEQLVNNRYIISAALTLFCLLILNTFCCCIRKSILALFYRREKY